MEKNGDSSVVVFFCIAFLMYFRVSKNITFLNYSNTNVRMQEAKLIFELILVRKIKLYFFFLFLRILINNSVPLPENRE